MNDNAQGGHFGWMRPMSGDGPRAPAECDPLGFDYQRMKSGEADAVAGRFRPAAEVFATIRRRIVA